MKGGRIDRVVEAAVQHLREVRGEDSKAEWRRDMLVHSMDATLTQVAYCVHALGALSLFSSEYHMVLAECPGVRISVTLHAAESYSPRDLTPEVRDQLGLEEGQSMALRRAYLEVWAFNFNGHRWSTSREWYTQPNDLRTPLARVYTGPYEKDYDSNESGPTPWAYLKAMEAFSHLWRENNEHTE